MATSQVRTPDRPSNLASFHTARKVSWTASSATWWSSSIRVRRAKRSAMSSVQSLHRVPLALMNLNQQIFIGTFLELRPRNIRGLAAEPRFGLHCPFVAPRGPFGSVLIRISCRGNKSRIEMASIRTELPHTDG